MPPHDISRRGFLLAGSAALMVGPAVESPLRLRVVETAGMRRFGYPVQTILPGIRPGPDFRLNRDGRAIPAQFRPVVGVGGEPSVALDFTASPDPLAEETYEVAFGAGVRPHPEPAGGLRVEQAGGVFRVSGTGLTYEVPADLVGALRRAGAGPREFLREGSPGFWLRSGQSPRTGVEKPGPPLRRTIHRQGPLAVGLRFEGTWPLDGDRKAPVVAELTFPSSKSWVEMAWAVDDRSEGRVIELGLDLDLAIGGSPTLVDLGADRTVYATLKGEERIRLEGGSPAGWQVVKSSGGEETLQATARREEDGRPPRPPEGWAHVMDATRCTAVAVADFGRRTTDRIEVAADGRVRLVRQFGPGSRSSKSLRAWFHFVGMPVQITAVTSPQSMLAPLKVEWL